MAGIRAMTGGARVGRATPPWRRTVGVIAASVAGSLLVASGVQAEDYPDYTRSSVYVPVRDGTKLAMNVYRPANGAGVVDEKLPVIFAFTPYRARYKGEDGRIVEAALGDQLALRSLLRAGYVVAVADIRGKGASFGHRRGFQDRTEARDGYDLVEWLARQPFSSGKVGMIGCSYLGGTTMHTVSTAPPSLKAAFIGATDWDKYAFVRRGGLTAQFNTRPDEPPAVDLASLPVDADPDAAMLREAVAEHAANTSMSGLWYSMPYRDSVSPLTGNDFWNEVAIWRYADTIRKSGIATYVWGNWKDEPTSQVLVAARNLGSRVLVGPGSHCVPPPGFDFTGEITRYFDHYLKNADNGFSGQPPVTFWSADDNGKGHYVRQDALPGAASTTWSWYLNGGDKDGQRGLSPRPGDSGTDRFTVDYDVANDAYFAFWPQPLDAHGITYTSAPFEHPVDLLGYPLAHLQLQSNRPDADVFVYLEEVSPGGSAQVLSFGRLKLSHRAIAPAPWDNLGLPWHSGLRNDVSPLGKGETARMEIAMMPLSHRIEPGYRLRFVMTGADPRQRNLAAVRQDPPPVLEIERGWQFGSRIDLPLREPRDDTIAGQIGGTGGRGTYPAVAQARADAPGYTIYRPQVLPEGKLPLVLWGNGGCRDDGLSAGHALREFASHGYLVIANGAPREERPVLAALPQPGEGAMRIPTEAERKPDETSTAQLLAAIDWAERVNADPADPLYGRVDTTRIAATGHSCGGLQALAAGADPRVDTVIAFGSGVYNQTGSGLSGVKIVKDDLKRLHTSVAYILGGPTDIAYPNGTDDFAKIAHIPVMLANLPVGHNGTLPLADGGEWARVGASWLDWQLKGDRQAGLMFTGNDCGLCKSPDWTVQRKNFPAKP